jgi:cbb3-type cytochrome oxidase maturation protein
MLASIIILIILSCCLGTGAWLIFIWAVQKGEFDDVEGPKYRMLEDDPEPQPRGDDNDP